jgi:hypothetical protein
MPFRTILAVVAVSVCCGALLAEGIKIEHDPGGSIADTKDKPLTYGLKVTAPWKDGGHVIINLPEHLTYGTNERPILRWSDNRQFKEPQNAWKISEDGREATLDIASPYDAQVRIVGKVKAEGENRVRLSMKIVNNTDHDLDAIRALYCTHYRLLTGFPRWQQGFPFTWLLVNGRWTRLADLPTKDEKTLVKWARVKGRDVRPNEFVTSRGGAIAKPLDAAAAVVSDTDQQRRLAVAWKPGGTMLSNADIPCIHVDPFYETVPPGESREAEGLMIFTEEPLDKILEQFRKEGFVEAEKPQ